MKITNWCKKLSAALVAGGLLIPCAASAADLGTNLVVNPGFENVDLATTSFYNAPKILDWVSAVPGFAYSHDGSSSNTGVVPDYANGGPLAGGGHWYFTPGNGGNDSFADALKQVIDVSAGPTAAAIAGGNATYDLSAYFSTYAAQADRAFIQVDFLDVANANLGSAQISSPIAPPLATWTQFSTSGFVPAGTQSVRISSWGEVFVGSGGSPDGYQDNISFSIVPEPASVAMAGIGLAASIGLLRRRRDDDSS